MANQGRKPSKIYKGSVKGENSSCRPFQFARNPDLMDFAGRNMGIGRQMSIMV
jgi:hypothetical protein